MQIAHGQVYARELITLYLTGRRDELEKRALDLTDHYAYTAAKTLCIMAMALGDTFGSLEEFSAHVIAADLAEFDGPPSPGKEGK